MRHTEVYSAVEIRQWATDEEYKPGKWAPVRPLSYSFQIPLLWRSIKIAFKVLIGKYDALNWEGDRS